MRRSRQLRNPSVRARGIRVNGCCGVLLRGTGHNHGLPWHGKPPGADTKRQNRGVKP